MIQHLGRDEFEPNADGEGGAIARQEAGCGQPNTITSLVADLRSLSITAEVLMVHTSLSAIGWVAGGADAVVDALVEAFGTATLAVPTQTSNLCDPRHWSNPSVPEAWWATIRDHLPAFDPARTPSVGVGAIPEAFRRHAGACRSNHPTVSFAAIGPLAAMIVDPHPLTPQFGEQSPLARLYELDATVLMIGTNHQTNTSLHLAEQRAHWLGKADPISDGSPMLIDGQRRWVMYEDCPAEAGDFESCGQAFAALGREHEGMVGLAHTRWFSMREVVDFAVPWFTVNRAVSA